jgi:hypothetical protein
VEAKLTKSKSSQCMHLQGIYYRFVKTLLYATFVSTWMGPWLVWLFLGSTVGFKDRRREEQSRDRLQVVERCGVLNGTGPLKVQFQNSIFKFSISSRLKISILSPQIPTQSNGFLILLFYFIFSYYLLFILFFLFFILILFFIILLFLLIFFKSLTQNTVLFLISWS